jgi:hypothetical protein
MVQSMMKRTVGYPGGKEPEAVQKITPAQPELGTVFV